MSKRSQHLYEFGPYRLDTAEGLLLRDGEPVPLTPKAFETLVALVERSGHLVEKDELMKAVWSDAFVEESNLTSNVYALRKMLGQGEKGRSYIETVPKRGYRFTAPVRALTPETLVVEKRTLTRVVTEETVADDSSQKPLIGMGEALVIDRAGIQTVSSKWRWLLIALLSLSLVIGAIFAYRAVTANRSLTAAPRPQIESIAVLPFKNESGNPDVEYLSDGVTELLINSLAQLPQLKVTARNSVFQFKGKEENVRQIASDLAVQGILIGRVAQHGDDLIVSVELLDARDNAQIWGERYSRKTADLQALQEEVAQTIAQKLISRLGQPQQPDFTTHQMQNPQAYQSYLNGLFCLRKGGFNNVKNALDYFNQAVALDSSFALAWVGIADAHLYLAGNSLLDPKEARSKAKPALQKALALDENLAEAHVTLAIIKEQEWDWAGAEREYKRALELNPNSVRARTWYANYLSSMERHAEAIAEVKRAQEIDPLDVGLKAREAWALSVAGQHDESIEKFQQVLKIEPTFQRHGQLAFAYENKGMYAEAAEQFRKAISLQGETTSGLCYLGYDLAMSGQKKEAQAILARLRSTREYISPEEFAGFYAGLGDKEAALVLLQKAYADHDMQLQVMKIDGRLQSLHSDLRFQDLIRRMGFPN